MTHDGVKLPCMALPNLSSFRQKFGADAYEQVSKLKNLMNCIIENDTYCTPKNNNNKKNRMMFNA